MGAGGGYGYQGDVPPLPEAEERRRSSALAAINGPRSLVQVYFMVLRDSLRKKAPVFVFGGKLKGDEHTRLVQGGAPSA